MLSCPFCGHAVDIENGDTLCPNAIGWKDMEYGRAYFSFREVPPEQWCYSFHCPTTSGGCGCEMSADTEEEAIKKWNTRV